MRRVALLLALLVLPLRSQADASGEALCASLGSVCLCSESLDSTEAITTNGQNFTNSTVNDCGNTLDTSSITNLRFVTETGMPGGNTVANVLEMDGAPPTGGPVYHIVGEAPAFTTGTMCARIYQKFSQALTDAHSDGGTADRIKLQEFTWQGGACLSQNEWWTPSGGSSGLKTEIIGCTDVSSSASTPNAVTLQECTDSWCRMEYCVTVSSSSTTSTRSKVTVVNDARNRIQNLTQATSFSGIGHTWIGNLYVQNMSVTDRRYASYAIQTLWPTAQADTVWIGAASEVEGGAAAPPGSQGSGSFSLHSLLYLPREAHTMLHALEMQ